MTRRATFTQAEITRAMQHTERLQAALDKLAALVAHDLDYAPIFERLDAELQAAQGGNRADRARLLIQRARVAV